MQAVILAGGEGLRLKPLTQSIPKPMIPIAGKPFLEHLINLLRRNSVDEIVICTGYRGEVISSYFGNGESFGVRIRYSDDGDQLLGTAGSLKNAALLLNERFFITFADAYPIIDYKDAWTQFVTRRKLVLMVVYRNLNHFGESNTVVQKGLVTCYSKKIRTKGMEYIEVGVTFIEKRALEMIPASYPADLETLYSKVIAKNQMVAFEVQQRNYDIGTLDRLTEFRELVEKGHIKL